MFCIAKMVLRSLRVVLVRALRSSSPSTVCATAVAAGLLVLSISGPTFAQTQPAADANADAFAKIAGSGQLAALVGAQQALQALCRAPSGVELAEALSNRSAAAFALGQTARLADAIAANVQGGKRGGRFRFDPYVSHDFSDLLSRYGVQAAVHDDAHLIAEVQPQIEQHGREFLVELSAMQVRLAGALRASGRPSDGLVFTDPVDVDPDTFSFRVVSKAEVALSPIDPATLAMPGMNSLRAIFEDGAWRIDVGRPDEAFAGASGRAEAARLYVSERDAMFNAVDAQDIASINALLQKNPLLVNARNDSGETPLFATIFWDYEDVAQFLIDHGANINARTHSDQTPLDLALSYHRPRMEALLQRYGAERGGTLIIEIL